MEKFDEENSKLQQLMNAAYERWQANSQECHRMVAEVKERNGSESEVEAAVAEARKHGWSYEGFVDQLSAEERVAVLVGNLNYQVCNGGFAQWHDNGYSKFADDVVGILEEIGSQACRTVAQLVERAQRAIGDGEDENDHRNRMRWDDDEDEGFDYDGDAIMEELEAAGLDDKFYEINDQMLADVEAHLNGQPPPKSEVEPEPLPKKKPVVQLTGTDGNAFAVIGTVKRALKKAGYSQAELEQFVAEATSGDYNGVLATAMKWADVR